MKAKILCVFVLVLACLNYSSASERGTQKAAELRKQMLSSNDNIILLSAADYKEYVLTEPRPYDLVVFFTAYSCKFCDEVYESYKEAAASYIEAKAIYPSKEESHMPSGYNREDYLKKYMLDASRSSVHVGTQKILEYVNERVARKVEHKETVLKLFYVLLALGIPFAAIIKTYIRFRKYANHPIFWLFGSYIVYFVCMSGLVYCILHGTPFVTQANNGEIQWWTSGSRNQLGLEGWIMSGSILLTGVALMLIQHIHVFAGENRYQRYVIFMSSLVLTWIGMSFVEDIYRKKGGWTVSSFYPPLHYIKGGLMRDQGNTI